MNKLLDQTTNENKWKPQLNQPYFYIETDGRFDVKVLKARCGDNVSTELRAKRNNQFKTVGEITQEDIDTQRDYDKWIRDYCSSKGSEELEEGRKMLQKEQFRLDELMYNLEQSQNKLTDKEKKLERKEDELTNFKINLIGCCVVEVIAAIVLAALYLVR